MEDSAVLEEENYAACFLSLEKQKIYAKSKFHGKI